MKNDSIIKIIIGAVLVMGVAGAGLDFMFNRESIHNMISQEVTITGQAEYNVMLQQKITPVVHLTQEALAMRKVYTEISIPDYNLKIDRTVEAIDIAISDILLESATANQKLSRDRTIGSLGKLKVDLLDLKNKLNNDGTGKTLFEFQNNPEYEQIYTRIANSLMEINDYIGLGEEIREINDGIQR